MPPKHVRTAATVGGVIFHYSILTAAYKPLAGRACSEAHPKLDMKIICGRSVTEYPMPVTISKPNGTKTEECKAVE